MNYLLKVENCYQSLPYNSHLMQAQQNPWKVADQKDENNHHIDGCQPEKIIH